VQRLEPALLGRYGPEGPRGVGSLLWRRTAGGGVQELRGQGALGAQGPSAGFGAFSGGEHLSGWAAGRWGPSASGLSLGGLAGVGPAQLELGLWAEEAPLGRAGLALALPASLRVEAGWRAPLAEPWPGWSRTFGVSWLHPTGCAGLALSAQLDADRAAPDLALRLTASP
jgi:hypothetical protein